MPTNGRKSARSSGREYGRQLRRQMEAATDEGVLYHLMQQAIETAQRYKKLGATYFTAWREGLLESFPEGADEMAEV